MPMRKLSTFLAVLALFGGPTIKPATALPFVSILNPIGDILIYADDPYHPAPNTFIDQALTLLGLAYTGYYNGDWANFESELKSGGPWDLVIVGNDYYTPSGDTLDALNKYTAEGGKLILHSFFVGSQASSPLWHTLGFTFIANDANPPDPVYWWEPGYPPFAYPLTVPMFTSLTARAGYSVYGQRVQPRSGFQALAGYSIGPQRDQAALVVGNDTRTIFKAFLDGQNDSDLNLNSLLDSVELWINLINWILTPGTWGVLEGSVVGLGYCDSTPSPLEAALVLIEAGSSYWQLYTDSSGKYEWWTQQTGVQLDMSVYYLGYNSADGYVSINPGQTTTFDFSLRWYQPCLQLNPETVVTFMHRDEQLTEALQIENYGLGAAEWELSETTDPLVEPLDIAWFSTSPITGTLSGDAQQPVDVNLDALPGLPYGQYTAYLRIDSNDPVQPVQFVPVMMQIAAEYIYLPVIKR